MKTILRILILCTLGILVGGFLMTLAEAETETRYCYEPYGTAVIPEHIATQALIQIRWEDTERAGDANSSWLYDEETKTGVCVIWVRMPEQILGDPDMDALGHEVLHCLIGDFHPEDE